MIRRDRAIWPTTWAFVVIIMVLGGVNVVDVFLVRESLHTPAALYGLSEVVAAIGGVVGSVIAARIATESSLLPTGVAAAGRARTRPAAHPYPAHRVRVRPRGGRQRAAERVPDARDRPAGRRPLVDWDDRTILALLRVTKNNMNAYAAFTPPRFHGTVLFAAATLTQADYGWSLDDWLPYVDGRIDDHPVACRHEHMMQPVPMAEIGRILAARLARDGGQFVGRPTVTIDHIGWKS